LGLEVNKSINERTTAERANARLKDEFSGLVVRVGYVVMPK
jgi:hypothetical protein